MVTLVCVSAPDSSGRPLGAARQSQHQQGTRPAQSGHRQRHQHRPRLHHLHRQCHHLGLRPRKLPADAKKHAQGGHH